MTARIVAELWCDRCFGAVEVAPDADGTEINDTDELRRVAKQGGWSRSRWGVELEDLCPSCTTLTPAQRRAVRR